MNREAGRGMLLFVKIRLESGDEIACAVDTGAPTSHLPKEVEDRLGRRLGTRKFTTLDGDIVTEHLYSSPKLYLGSTRLIIGDRIGVAGERMGVLGMDCLRHYCIQLDFQAGRMRFLKPDELDAQDLGKAFPLVGLRYAAIKDGGLFASRDSEVLVDSGCPFDACLEPERFRQQFNEQRASAIPMLKDAIIHDESPGYAQFSQRDWNGWNYTNLIVGTGPNLIGLRFLARHSVTFNFPKGVMYLKQVTVGPLGSEPEDAHKKP